MDGTLTFLQAARIVGLGLNFNLLDRDGVIAWADARIAEISEPPCWLLELATSRNLWPYDAAKLVLPNVPEVPVDLACGVILALLPNLETIPEGKLPAMGAFIYRVVRDICNSDWRNRAVCDADQISDSFALIKDGVIQQTIESMRYEMADFIVKYSLPAAAISVHPICIHLTFSEQQM